MPRISRRLFLKTTGLAALGATLPACSTFQVSPRRVIGANSDIRLGIAGLNGRGKDLVKEFDALPGVRIVALCDVDSVPLAAAAKGLRDKGRVLETYTDFREMLDEGDVDAVAIATPNHQHSLQAIWACQARKDVYLEKPVSHNIWEGQQLLKAVEKYGSIAQTGSQCRSSDSLAEAVAWVRAGNLGKILWARGMCYKRRDTIGLSTAADVVPATVDYNLWLGPAPEAPLHRKKFHYDWHWQWPYGNGDLGNQGVHQVDIARWFLGESKLPPHVLSVGGRLGYIDDGQTPNEFVIVFDYQKAPLIFEVRGLPSQPGAKTMDAYRKVSIGVIVQCEGGYVVVPDYVTAQAYDNNDQLLKKFTGSSGHGKNFIDAMRSGKTSDLHAPISEGRISTALALAGNISYRTGQNLPPAAIREQINANASLSEAYGRMADHLGVNGIDLTKTPVTLGAALTINPHTERFVDNAAANALFAREYRKPFVVPTWV